MIGTSAIRGTNWGRLGALAAIAVAVALFLGWQSGEMVVAPDPPGPRTRWALPAHANEDAAKDLALLTARKPWSAGFGGFGEGGPDGTGPGGGKKGSEATEWRLAGVGDRPDGSFALIAIGKSGAVKYEYHSIGDKLPDGSTLIEISAESATTRVGGSDGKQSVHWLFRGELPGSAPVAPAPGPAAPPANRRAELPSPPMPSAAPKAGRPRGRVHDGAARGRWVRQ